MPDTLPAAFWVALGLPVLVLAAVIFASKSHSPRRRKSGGGDGAYPYAADTGSDGGCGGDGGSGSG